MTSNTLMLLFVFAASVFTCTVALKCYRSQLKCTKIMEAQIKYSRVPVDNSELKQLIDDYLTKLLPDLYKREQAETQFQSAAKPITMDDIRKVYKDMEDSGLLPHDIAWKGFWTPITPAAMSERPIKLRYPLLGDTTLNAKPQFNPGGQVAPEPKLDEPPIISVLDDKSWNVSSPCTCTECQEDEESE